MKTRIDLHSMLEAILGSENVYFQPPESVKMSYPAIVYSRDRITNDYADNIVYKQEPAYMITVIDKNPDSEIVSKVSKIPRCRYERGYRSNNLNHDVFFIYW